MKRRPMTKAELIARLHRGLRPKLDRGQLVDLGLVHLENLAAIAEGRAHEEILWQVVGGTLTWSRVADKLGIGVDEMNVQLQLSTSLVERYGRTGRVGFSGPEYQVAKLGVQVMDQLAELVDRPTAVEAANWSEAQVNDMAAKARQQREQPEAQAA